MEENEHIYSWPLPHLRVDAPFVQIPLIDENQKIKMWHPYNEKYILLPITDINSGLYFSLDKKNMNDSYIKFIDFIYQKIKLFNTSTIAKIERDILNLQNISPRLTLFYIKFILCVFDPRQVTFYHESKLWLLAVLNVAKNADKLS
jgi:hypothetical protein